MIVPINNGRSTTLIYTPPVVTVNSGVLEQSNTNAQNNEPTLETWVVGGVVLIFLIICSIYFIKLLKHFLGGEE